MKGARTTERRPSVTAVLVPLMLLTSSLIMSMAWLGHLRFKAELDLLTATGLAWLLVLPEYALNIKALRMGYGIYLAAQMAAFRLCAGVVWIALVSRYLLGEELTAQKLVGFAIMIVAMVLVGSPPPQDHEELAEGSR
jgi:uncharacterized protein (DUF486 family)